MTIVETIEPPSAARETWAVLRAAFVVVGGALCVIAAGRAPAGTPPTLPPFQARYATLDAPSQATFRAIAEALPELEARRVDEGGWPTPAALAEAGLPPFAGDALRWSLRVEGAYAAYVGVPRGADAGGAFVVHFAEPAAADPAAAAGPPLTAPVIDETHHRLPDGRMVHATVWSRPPCAPSACTAPDPLDRPMLSGWIQYLAADPRPEPRS